MTRSAPRNGFVLVGVVMFVLALTILGLSLFTLSSYEAQSLTQSHARTQGSYDAESGVEMVKALIMTGPSFSLASAGAAVGSFNVISAVAKQHRSGGLWDSTGVVTGDSTVWIRVTSQNYGERKTLEARFRPNQPRDYYNRLFTVARSVTVQNFGGTPSTQRPADQLILSGPGWQQVVSSADTAWAQQLPSALRQTTWTGPHFEYTDAVTLPDLPAYFASRPPTPFLPTLTKSGRDKLEFDVHDTTLPVAYYRSPPSEGPGPYTFEDIRSVDISVEGTVVWLIPAGVHFQQQVIISKSNKSSRRAVLVIVAGQSLSSDAAINFEGGVNVASTSGVSLGDQVNVILVTDARTLIEFVNEPNTYDCRLNRLSLFCRDLSLMGPEKGPPYPGKILQLSHDPTTMAAVIQDLYSDPSDPLPRPTGSASALTLIRGSWRSATP